MYFSHSVLEMEVEKGVFSPESSSDSIMWAHRVFKGMDTNDSSASNYLDLVQTEDGREIDNEVRDSPDGFCRIKKTILETEVEDGLMKKTK